MVFLIGKCSVPYTHTITENIQDACPIKAKEKSKLFKIQHNVFLETDININYNTFTIDRS